MLWKMPTETATAYAAFSPGSFPTHEHTQRSPLFIGSCNLPVDPISPPNTRTFSALVDFFQRKIKDNLGRLAKSVSWFWDGNGGGIREKAASFHNRRTTGVNASNSQKLWCGGRGVNTLPRFQVLFSQHLDNSLFFYAIRPQLPSPVWCERALIVLNHAQNDFTLYLRKWLMWLRIVHHRLCVAPQCMIQDKKQGHCASVKAVRP